MIPSGTVIFVFTDVVGSTRLWAADEEAMSASLRIHDQILRAAIEANDGHVFGTAGDSFAAAFSRASSALRAAERIHHELETAAWPGPELEVRIGIHLGEAEERDHNYLGPVVNTAARVEEAANAGQTLITEAVRVAARITDSTDLGLHRLRDVDELVHLHQVGQVEFPPPRTGARAKSAPTASGLPRAWVVLHQPGRAPETVELVRELTVGRDVGRSPVDGHLATHDDQTVSRLHAVLTPKAAGWCVQAVNSRNGLFVNGERLAEGSVHLLHDGDRIRMGERTMLRFESEAGNDDRSSTEAARPTPDVGTEERRVLLALCRPVLDGDALTSPASAAAIAAELEETEEAVIRHLDRLAERFGVSEADDRHTQLAREALECGAVRLADLRSQPG